MKRTSDKFRGIVNNCPIFAWILYEKFGQNSKVKEIDMDKSYNKPRLFVFLA